MDEPVIEILPDETAATEYPAIYYPWVADLDEWRRCWIFEVLVGDTREDVPPGKTLVENMALIETYLKTGAATAVATPKLKVVKDGT
jgi:hypothetical protein